MQSKPVQQSIRELLQLEMTALVSKPKPLKLGVQL